MSQRLTRWHYSMCATLWTRGSAQGGMITPKSSSRRRGLRHCVLSHYIDWKREHNILSVLIECKNQKRLSYGDLRQTACYLGKTMGRLGILTSRKTAADDVWDILNWFVSNDDKYILVVNDQNLVDWIRLK